MTMHLLGPAYTTTATRKRNSKMTDSKFTKYAMDWRDDCKRCKKLGIEPRSLNDYVEYRKGNYKPKLRGTPKPKYQISNLRELYPSAEGVAQSFAKTPNTYTGTLIKGISTLHKSNAVPVISEEEMHDHANMRR